MIENPRKLQRATAVLLIFLEKTIGLLSSSATDAEDGEEEALYCRNADGSMHGPWRWRERASEVHPSIKHAFDATLPQIFTRTPQLLAVQLVQCGRHRLLHDPKV